MSAVLRRDAVELDRSDGVKSVVIARNERLTKIRGSRELLEASKLHYAENPVDFINDWMITYDPRVQPSYMPFVLFPKQVEYINWLHDRYRNREDGLVEKSRDMGVTWLCCAYAVWMWIFVPGSAVAFGSRKEDLVDRVGDPDSIFEKMRIILDNLPIEYLPEGFELSRHATHMKIVHPMRGGSVIKGEAGDNIGRGGRSSLYFKDEAAFYERPERIEAALSMNSDVKIDVSTPNGNGNPFYRKRHGGKVPVFTFFWRDDPRKHDAWYQRQKRDLDPVILAQEVELDYNASVGNALIPNDLVSAAMGNRAVDVFGNDENRAPKILGVDVARFGDDRTVMALRQGRHVLWYAIIPPGDNVAVVGEVMGVAGEYDLDAIVVDVVGVGAGVFDMLNARLSYVYAVNAGSTAYDKAKYFNRRAEMWDRLRGWLRDGPVILPKHGDCVSDLCSLRYAYNANGQLVLEKKEDAKKRGVRSPDIGDAIALTFAESIAGRDDYYADASLAGVIEHDIDRSRSAITGY